MKTLLLITIVTAQLAYYAAAIPPVPLPEIPVPKPAMTEAVAIAQRNLATTITDSTNYVLVSVCWHKVSDYSPPFSDGTQWQAPNDHPDDYSWFLTYVYYDETSARPENSKHRFNSVLVIRIKDDGKIGPYFGART